jgi:hypothetical protein
LFTVGARGANYLTVVLRQPKRIFPETVMPSYKLAPDVERALLAYLLSLRGDYIPPKRPPQSKERCATCHAGAKADPTKGLAAHRCAWIAEERANLTCQKCHAKGVPAGDKECLYIRQQRSECGICHQGGIDGR